METLDNRIITIGRFSYIRSLLLQGILHDAKIETFLVSKDVIFPPKYTDIRVKEKDVEKAMNIINSYKFDSVEEKNKSLNQLLVMRRIMVPVDFSVSSLNAAKFACSIANRFKSEVMLVHVSFNPILEISPYSEYYDYQKRLSDNLKEINDLAKNNLLKLEDNIKDYCKENNFNNVKVASKLLSGTITQDILDYSEKYNPFLIIMGIRGLSADNQHTYGRIADQVIRKSKIPVLAIPQDEVSKITDIKEIVYIMDYDEHNLSSINKIIQMMFPLKIKIHCIHFSLARTKPWDKAKLEEIENNLLLQYKDVDITFQNVVSSVFSNGLQTFIRNNNVGAIAITTYKKNFLEKLLQPDFSETIFKATGKPILFFPVR